MVTGASYQPELIELMKTALDEAASTLPVARQTPAMKATLASRILCAAALGVRDPIQLRIAALISVEENDIHRSYSQLKCLRQQVEEAEAADNRRMRIAGRIRERRTGASPADRSRQTFRRDWATSLNNMKGRATQAGLISVTCHRLAPLVGQASAFGGSAVITAAAPGNGQDDNGKQVSFAR